MSQIIDTIAAHYNFEREKLTRMSEGFQNQVFKIEGKILRVSPRQRRTLSMIEAELTWLQYLRNNGILLGAPTQIEGFNHVEEITLENQCYYAVFFEEVKGNPVDVMNPEQWNSNFYQEWGRVVGRLHALSQSGPQRLCRPRWTNNNIEILELKPNLDGSFLEKYQKLLCNLNSYAPTKEAYGLIHNDLHQGNFHVISGKPVLFDFDDCAYNWFAYDVAVSLYHACWQQAAFNGDLLTNFPNQFLSSFLEGYEKENQFTDTLIQQIPIFLKIRDIFLYNLFKKEWDPNYMQEWQSEKLRELEFNILSESCFIQL
ncbi:phosphotransferase [Bacillus carboniphilus]|uniref:Phosphotransferase n=1 Tax=Bacillus carboniphilus TaxID=86663 RepID=A0ABN0W832_9BACI